MALTDTALKALKPKDNPYTVADERGLYVEVFPTGGIAWRVVFQLCLLIIKHRHRIHSDSRIVR